MKINKKNINSLKKELIKSLSAGKLCLRRKIRIFMVVYFTETSAGNAHMRKRKEKKW